MTLGINIQTLVILIPNEGHHSEGEDNEAEIFGPTLCARKFSH